MADTAKNYAKRLPGIRQVIAERDRLKKDREWLLAERYALQAALAQVGDERDRLFARVVDGAENPRPQADRHLFVVTYGRSGSTLLQGVLNSIPGYLIRGENHQIALRLMQYHVTAMADRENLRRELRTRSFEGAAASWSLGLPLADPTLSPVPASDATRPWFGIEGYDDNIAFRAFRELFDATVLRPTPDTRVCGFKEVRWPTEELLAFLRFLQDVFPATRFIVNTRDLSAVLRSKWWAEDPSAERKLRDTETSMLDAAAALGDDAFHIHYDDWKTSPAKLGPLFDWLGEELDEERVGAVFGERHSY